MIIQQHQGVHLLTVDHIEGYKVGDYFGSVSATTVYGANFVKDFMAGLSDKLGGRARGYETSMQAAIEGAFKRLATNARELGGNAVLNIRIITNVTGRGVMIATATGTVVRLLKDDKGRAGTDS